MLFRSLTDWVITQAVKQVAAWHDDGVTVKVSVNLSVKDLLRDDLYQKISSILGKYKLAPQYLDVEITESVALVNAEQSIQLLDSLKEMGISISLDDFGTGYSSISHLTSLPVDIVKIDQSFIRKVNTPSSHKTADGPKYDNRLIIENIIRLARSFNLTSVVEGVETIEQLNLLREFDCDLIQGYLLSRPVTAEELTPVIAQGYIDLESLTDTG